jgi:hypothetical protein
VSPSIPNELSRPFLAVSLGRCPFPSYGPTDCSGTPAVARPASELLSMSAAFWPPVAPPGFLTGSPHRTFAVFSPVDSIDSYGRQGTRAGLLPCRRAESIRGRSETSMTHRFTTVDPQKWLGILQRWHPRMPRDELVNFINEFIEALRAKRGKDRAVHRGNPLVHRKENFTAAVKDGPPLQGWRGSPRTRLPQGTVNRPQPGIERAC